MKILVLGAGMLSYYFRPYQLYFASKTNKDWENFHICDIRNPKTLEIVVNKVEPDIIINTAALGNIRRCEQYPKLVEEINHLAHKNVISLCNEKDIKLVYISTSSVFNGKKGDYKEDDEPHPTTVYGQTKLRGEKATQKYAKDWIILRPTAIFGDYPGTMDFIQKTIYELSLGNNFTCWDQIISPSWGPFVADMILKLIEKNVTGIWHVAGKEQLSRFEIGEVIQKYVKNGQITRVETPIDLPLNRSLCVEKLKGELPGLEFPCFEDIMKRMVNEKIGKKV